jgi:Leucine-rich repeat (LRR) protein
LELSGLKNISYISGNNNKIANLKGLETLTKLTSISLCTVVAMKAQTK